MLLKYQSFRLVPSILCSRCTCITFAIFTHFVSANIPNNHYMEEFRIIKFQNRHKKSGLSHHSTPTPPQHQAPTETQYKPPVSPM